MKFSVSSAVVSIAFATFSAAAPVDIQSICASITSDVAATLPFDIRTACNTAPVVTDISVKRRDNTTSSAVSSIPDALSAAESVVSGLLGQLDIEDLGVSTVTDVVGQLTSTLTSLTSSLNILSGLGLATDQLLGGQPKETVAQRVAALANIITARLSSVEGVLATAAPELEGPINLLNGALQTVLSTVTGLVNELNGLVTPLLTPATGFLKALGLNLHIGLLGL